MENEKRLVEILADLPIKFDEFIEGQKETNQRLGKVEGEIGSVKSEISGVRGEIIKLNLQTAENTRAIIKLADKIDTIADLENRVSKIEKVVFK